MTTKFSLDIIFIHVPEDDDDGFYIDDRNYWDEDDEY